MNKAANLGKRGGLLNREQKPEVSDTTKAK